MRLVDDVPENADFAALSYSWGDSVQNMLVQYKYDSYKDKILLQHLPQTIRDAVVLTRALEIPFLWIDAFCIIQDNEADWDREASKMKYIYSGAKLVLSADRAATANEGFLLLRIDCGQKFKLKSSAPPVPFPDELVVFPAGWEDRDPSEAMHHYVLDYGDDDVSAFHMRRNHPTFSRAWCMQEQQLALQDCPFHQVRNGMGMSSGRKM